MKLFILLLSIISGFTFSNKESWIISLTLLIFIIFILIKKYRKNICFICAIIISFCLFLLLGIITFRTFQNNSEFIGIVISKNNGYMVLYDGFEKIYFRSKDINIDFLDVIKISGYYRDVFVYRPLESAFDFKKYLNDIGISREISFTNYTTLFNFPINIEQIKIWILEKCNNDYCREIVKTYLFAEKDYSSEIFLSIKNLGLINLISLSGMYINGIHYIFYKFINRRKDNRVSYCVALILVMPLVFINIDRMSILRVFIYLVIRCILLFKGIRSSNLSIKCVPYLIIIFIDRYSIYNVAFVLSLVISMYMHFSSFYLYKFNKYKRKIINYMLFFFLLIPFSVLFNYSINILNYIVGIVLIPISKYIVLLMYIGLLLPKYYILNDVFQLYYTFLYKLDFKYLNINMDAFSQYFLVIYYLIIFLFLYFSEINLTSKKRLFSISYIAILLIKTLPVNNLIFNKVSFINVGQGDATLIQYGLYNVLIDTGGSLNNDIAVNSLIPYFRRNKIYKIDKVYITHYDLDHYYALDSLKENFIVGEVIDYNTFSMRKDNKLLIHNLNNYYDKYVEENYKSMILYFEISKKYFLIMGDAPKEIELKLIKDYPNLRVDYLKVGHHGSNTSTAEQFVKFLQPKEAIISCGENNIYKHPNSETLKVLTENNVEIRRTDEEGTISYKFLR